jgi:hypothetical protein
MRPPTDEAGRVGGGGRTLRARRGGAEAKAIGVGVAGGCEEGRSRPRLWWGGAEEEGLGCGLVWCGVVTTPAARVVPSPLRNGGGESGGWMLLPSGHRKAR